MPCAQTTEDFAFHILRSSESQIGFHAGEGVGRKTDSLIDGHGNHVFKIKFVKGLGNQAHFLGVCGVQAIKIALTVGAEFFFADNFTAKPKDNFGIVFCRMFGLQGLYTLWLGLELTPAKMLPYFAIFNAAIIFVGPQMCTIAGWWFDNINTSFFRTLKP